VKLLVAALASELSAFPDEIPGFDRLITGAGKLNATYALTRALSGAEYDEIVVVGTAGASDPTLELTAHEITAAVQHDVRDIDGTFGRHVSDSVPDRVSTGRAGVVIATGDSFVDDAESTATIRSLGASLVDMETYAYIWVAERFGVPIRAFRAVSDNAEDGAYEDWTAALDACSRQLWARFQREFDV